MRDKDSGKGDLLVRWVSLLASEPASSTTRVAQFGDEEDTSVQEENSTPGSSCRRGRTPTNVKPTWRSYSAEGPIVPCGTTRFAGIVDSGW